jgi:ribosome maturation factor RimP
MGVQEATRESVVARVLEIAERVGASEGIEIVDVEFKGGGSHRLLRVFIDKPQGVSHADCEFMSRQIGTILDIDDVVPGGAYHLEISSPGIDRPLKRPRDFEKFLGRKAKVTLRSPVAARRQFEGVLTGFSNGIVTIQPATGEPVSFQLDLVERANLKFEW